MRYLWKSKGLILMNLMSLILGFYVSSIRSSASPTGVAYAVWDRGCFELEKDARAEAPMVDGGPDYKRVKLTGLILHQRCIHFEIKK